MYKLLKTSGKHSKVDFHKVKELRWNRKTYREIGEIFGVTRQCIEQICKKYGFEVAPESPVIKHPFEKQFNLIMNNHKVSERGCWEWTKALSKQNYSRITFRGKSNYGHRVSWIVFNGEIPEGLCVCHSCDNPKCINPDHLWLGTHEDNMRDRDLKHRNKKYSK